MKIKFCGAAREVTGSKHLLEFDGKKVLLDCGFFQGRRKESFEKNSHFPFDPTEIDAVVLSHAHVDHCGNLPTLVKNSFSGEIFCTAATAEIVKLMLFDSAHIQKSDSRFFNKRLRNSKLPIEPLFDESDVEKTISLLRVKKMREKFAIGKLKVEFFDAGHVLGSVISRIEFNGKSLVFTGDLGRENRNILRDPEIPPAADFLICESTYGDRSHPPTENNREKLGKIVRATADRGGKIIIPSFALERTQEIIFDLQILLQKNEIPKMPIIIDSPLATKVSAVFESCTQFFDAETKQQISGGRKLFDGIEFTESVDDSKAINFRPGPMIVISASGMCEAGRIRHHLFNSITNDRNTILIVGFQAAHTLGRKLVEGEKSIKIFDQILPVNAAVEKINGYSAHADCNEISTAIEKIKNLKKIFLVHGEESQSLVLAEKLRSEFSAKIAVPKFTEIVEI